MDTYRSWVGRPETYDILALHQLQVLTLLGLREWHKVLDLGCGSLRLGRLLMPFLLRGRYFAVEPRTEMVESGLAHETGFDIIRVKAPMIASFDDWALGRFGEKFDIVLAHSIFTHAASDLSLQILCQVRNVLNSNGMMVATFIEEEHPFRRAGVEWTYPDCISYHPEEIKRLLSRSGMECARLRVPDYGPKWWIGTLHRDALLQHRHLL